MELRMKLSQCMIVKNEEKDIERALSWGKEIMYEQIVVDTGSTDKTVEIAKALGAKVYHFEWKNDFSSAKNFALSKATGNWIAFLDADEYIHKNDLDKLVRRLNDIVQRNEQGEEIQALSLRIYNLDDGNVLQSGGVNERFFENTPDIRYKNRIHECIRKKDGTVPEIFDETIAILHTGYQRSSVLAKNKAERNLPLILRELQENPEDDIWWYYLGDSYALAGEDEKAIAAYQTVIDHWKARIDVRLFSITALIRIYTIEKDCKKYEQKVVALYQKYRTLKIVDPDVELAVGFYFCKIRKYDIAIQFLEGTLELMEGMESTEVSILATSNLHRIYRNLATLYKEKNDLSSMIKYIVLLLKIHPYDVVALKTLLETFYSNSENTEEVYQFLEKLYHFDTFKDKYFIMKTAKVVNYIELSKKMCDTMTKEEQEYVLEEEKNKE